MSHKGFVRSRLFVDWKVQGALVGRVVLYWLACLAAIPLCLLCWQVLSEPMRPFRAQLTVLWGHLAPAMAASLLLMLPVIFDVVRMSNRFAGPVLRLRRAMRDLAAGLPVEPLRFRRKDFWREFADEFNAVAARVQKSDSEPKPNPEKHEELIGV
jgi:hypothetical protein